MDRTIKIRAGGIELEAVLNYSETADAIWEALPVRANANLWGEEIYFPIPVKLGLEKGQELVEMGSLGYWPPGNAFCIFFGPTPASTGKKPRAASPVNILGHVMGDARQFRIVQNGTTVRVDRSEKVQP